MEVISYKKAFIIALSLHFFLALVLFLEPKTNNPVLIKETMNTPGNIMPVDIADEPQTIKAVSVDSKALSEAVNDLKLQKHKQQQAEVNRQRTLDKQAEVARQNRLKEQEHLVRLKKEAEALALKQKKQLEEEKRHLKALAEQKEKEAKRIAELKKEQDDLKKQQKKEVEQLAALQKKQAEDKSKSDKILANKERQHQADARAIAMAEAANQAKMSGEVDKYKALILNAIGRQWILPDNVDHAMSSQFRIHLAPDGAVLEVNLTRSSGDPILDRSAQTAIYKASPLPVPTDPSAFNIFRDINLTVRPEQVRG
jgi:colicin import membrane protein